MSLASFLSIHIGHTLETLEKQSETEIREKISFINFNQIFLDRYWSKSIYTWLKALCAGAGNGTMGAQG